MLLKFVEFKEEELIRGALLHDYFLYDWHTSSSEHRLHGIHHPAKALVNAEKDFELTSVEKDIIKKHMFPLTIIPPRYRETVLVSIIDKLCCIYESFKPHAYKNGEIKFVYENSMK